MVGAIELRGRLPGATALAAAGRCDRRAEGEVGELVVEQKARRPQARAEGRSMVVVMASTLPSRSTIEKWLVPGCSTVSSSPGAGCGLRRRAGQGAGPWRLPG